MDSKKINPKLFTIGAVAKSFGVNENTIRRMEASGLLTPALIKASGYRYYDYRNISRIKMILTLRSLGLIYEDMRDFFKNPDDFTLVQDKLLEKKLALDALLNHTSRYIKPETPGEILIISHNKICFFKKTYKTHGPLDVSILDEFSSDVLTSAIKGKYPIDHLRPVTIFTVFNDYKDFNPYLPLDLTFCVPLRDTVDTADTFTIPSRTSLTFALSESVDFESALQNLEQTMAANHLVQSDVLSATFEIGRHLDTNIKDNSFLFHIMIPCRKV